MNDIDDIFRNTGDFITPFENIGETSQKRGQFPLLLKYMISQINFPFLYDETIKLERLLKTVYDIFKVNIIKSNELPFYLKDDRTMFFENENTIYIGIELNWSRSFSEFLILLDRLLTYSVHSYDVSVGMWNDVMKRFILMTRPPLINNFINPNSYQLLGRLSAQFMLSQEEAEKEIMKAYRRHFNSERLDADFTRRILEGMTDDGVFDGHPQKRRKYGV